MTGAEVPPVAGTVTIGALLAGQAERRPEAIFGMFPDRTLSFGTLDSEARAIAKGLAALGVMPGDNVAILMPNCADWLLAFFGALYAGATAVVLNARYKRHELDYTITNSRARILLTTDAIEDHVDFVELIHDVLPDLGEQADPQRLTLAAAPDLRALVLFGASRDPGFLARDELVALGRNGGDDGVDRTLAAIDPEDPAVIIYTSGTTSSPKGCVLTHSSVQHSWYTFAEVVDLRHGQKVWTPMAFYHTGGIGPMVAILSRGATLVAQPHFDAATILAQIAEHRIEHLYSGFPQMSLTVLQHPDYARDRFGFVRSMLNVGPPAMQYTIQALLPEGAAVLNLFGMTEGSGIVTFTPFDAPLDVRAITSGKPPAHTEIRIADPETGAVIGTGETGEIQFRGKGAFKLYYRDPENTAATIVEGGWVRTGDRGKIDSDGFLHYLGRLKDMLKVGGENVAAAEIEFFLNQHPDVKMVQVIGGADVRMGEVPIAFVERVPGGTVTADALIAMCQGQLSRWKIPAEILFVSEWPMSATKVQKFRLKALLPDSYREAEA